MNIASGEGDLLQGRQRNGRENARATEDVRATITMTFRHRPLRWAARAPSGDFINEEFKMFTKRTLLAATALLITCGSAKAIEFAPLTVEIPGDKSRVPWG